MMNPIPQCRMQAMHASSLGAARRHECNQFLKNEVQSPSYQQSPRKRRDKCSLRVAMLAKSLPHTRKADVFS
eukprot:4416022-Amphidinium_carterae.1